MKQYKIAVVGATGMVGRTFLKVLEEYKLPAESYTLFASARSAGSTVKFMGEDYTIKELTETSMKWIAVDDPTFIQKFVRTSIPSELK